MKIKKNVWLGKKKLRKKRIKDGQRRRIKKNPFRNSKEERGANLRFLQNKSENIREEHGSAGCAMKQKMKGWKRRRSEERILENLREIKEMSFKKDWEKWETNVSVHLQ